MVKLKYFTWEINEEEGVAFRQMPDGRQVVVHLQRSENPHPHQYEGWWPDTPPHRENLTVITGICLWDGRWQVEFVQQKKNILANRSPALPADRTKIYDYLAKKGHRIKKILIPEGPGEYHRLLLDWQVRKIRKIQPSRILYHLPVKEYHIYISEMEQLLGINIPKLHEELDLFAEKIREIIQGSFQREVEFIQPLKMGATAPVESFLWPYLNPETLGAKPQELIGVEDLVELRLSYEAWLQRGWIIPVLCGVIKIPHPYQEKSLLGKEVKEILL